MVTFSKVMLHQCSVFHAFIIYFCLFLIDSSIAHASKRGSSPKNESFVSGSVWGAESNGEGPRCMR